MQISKYGIVLTRCTISDIEQMRYWRNLEHVRVTMKYQELITPQQQIAWFTSLDVATNYYFIIKKNEIAIGVVNLKEVNFKTKQAEAGIFIGNIEHLNTITPILATITIMEFAFNDLKLETLKAKIAVNNVKAILFNESIGYKKQELQSDDEFHYYETNQQLFSEATKNIRCTLDKL